MTDLDTAVLPGKRRVLIADDLPDLWPIYRHHLNSLWVEVEFVADGLSAVRTALEKPFDLVLMDLVMPGLSGTEAADQLRRQGFTKPIVAVTAFGDLLVTETGIRDATTDGFAAVILKPIAGEQLRAVVSKLLPSTTWPPEMLEPSSAETLAHRRTLLTYLVDLPDSSTIIADAFAHHVAEPVRAMSRQVAGLAETFGMEDLAREAAILGRVVGHGQWDKAHFHLQSLRSLAQSELAQLR